MATIRQSRVKSRNFAAIDRVRKNINTCIKAVRKFINDLSKKKKTSEKGFETNCDRLQNFLYDADDNCKTLLAQVSELSTICIGIEFDDAADEARGYYWKLLRQYVISMLDFMKHIHKHIDNEGYPRAVRSILKNGTGAVARMDKTMEVNKEACSAITAYIGSPTFTQRCKEGRVAIHKNEIVGGTAEQRRALLKKIAGDDYDALVEKKRADRSFVVDDDDVDALFGIKKHNGGSGEEEEDDDDEDEEKYDDSDDDRASDEIDQHFEAADLDEESDSKEGISSDDESGEASQGTALWENAIAAKNAEAVKNVKKCATVVKGADRTYSLRTSLVRDAMREYGETIKYYQVGERELIRKSREKAKNGLNKRKKRSVAPDGKEELDSSSEDVSQEIAERAAALRRARKQKKKQKTTGAKTTTPAN